MPRPGGYFDDRLGVFAVTAATQVVTRVEFAVGDGCELLMPAELRFDVRDPFAVALVFGVSPGDDELVVWSFGLDLLTAGMVWPTGDGDVHIAPTCESGLVVITLSSPSGRAVLQALRGDVAAFLSAAYELVPAALAGVGARLDAELADIFNDGGIR